MKRRLRKKRTRRSLDLATYDLTANYPVSAFRFVAEGNDVPYVPTPRLASEFQNTEVALRVRVLEKMSDAMWVEVFSPEFSLKSEAILMFWGEFAKAVFGDKSLSQ